MDPAIELDQEKIIILIDYLNKDTHSISRINKSLGYNLKEIEAGINLLSNESKKREKKEEFENYKTSRNDYYQKLRHKRKELAKKEKETSFEERIKKIRDYLINEKYTVSTLHWNLKYSINEIEAGINLLPDDSKKSKNNEELEKCKKTQEGISKRGQEKLKERIKKGKEETSFEERIRKIRDYLIEEKYSFHTLNRNLGYNLQEIEAGINLLPDDSKKSKKKEEFENYRTVLNESSKRSRDKRQEQEGKNEKEETSFEERSKKVKDHLIEEKYSFRTLHKNLGYNLKEIEAGINLLPDDSKKSKKKEEFENYRTVIKECGKQSRDKRKKQRAQQIRSESEQGVFLTSSETASLSSLNETFNQQLAVQQTTYEFEQGVFLTSNDHTSLPSFNETFNPHRYSQPPQQTEQEQSVLEEIDSDFLNLFSQDQATSSCFALPSTSGGTNQAALDSHRKGASSSSQSFQFLVSYLENHESNQFETDNEQLSEKKTHDLQEMQME